jgi:hypothetical protein
MLMVELLARMPDLRRRIQREHVADAAGRCRDCHGARWPCEMSRLAIQADRLDGYRSPWPSPPYQNRRGPMPPPGMRRGPVPPPGPPRAPYPPPGGPSSWPAQRARRMPPAAPGYRPGPYPGGWSTAPPPVRATPYPARAAPYAGWSRPPPERRSPVPPPRSGWHSWPSGWTPDVEVPRRSDPAMFSLSDQRYEAGWGGSPGYAATFDPPEPRREQSGPLEDVLRWAR